MKAIGKRLQEKNLEGNLTGDGLIAGGLLIFGKDGEAKYMHKEVTGTPFDVDAIAAAVAAVRVSQSGGEPAVKEL